VKFALQFTPKFNEIISDPDKPRKVSDAGEEAGEGTESESDGNIIRFDSFRKK
jgi:hypothetical protein